MKKKECTVEIEGRLFKYGVRRSRRAKRLLLHVDGEGKIEVVVPWGVPISEGKRMVRERGDWLVEAIRTNAKRKREIKRYRFEDGELLPLLGDQRRLGLVIEPGRRRPFFADGEGFVQVKAGSKKEVKEALARWYKREARDYFEWQTRVMARRLNKEVGKIVVSDAGSQWGSCNKWTGRISLHWRLVLGPKGVADYVIAHEVAHLQESSHGKKFWRVVEKLYPEFEGQRKWLQRYGHTLVL